MQIVGRSVDEIHLADPQHQIDFCIRRERTADVKRGRARDAQALGGPPSTGGQTAGGNAVDGNVARP